MKNRLKLFLLSVITPLLCLGVSFGNGVDLNTFDYVGNYGHDYVDGINMNNNYTINVSLSSDKLYCVAVKSFKCEYPTMWGGGDCSYNVDLNLNNTNHTFSYIFGNSVVINSSSHINIPDSIGDVWCFLSEATGFASFSQLPDYVGFKFDLYSKDIFTIGVSDCSSVESDLNTCVSNYNTLKSSYNTLSGNYNTCIDTLNTRNGEIYTLNQQISTLSGDLSTCQSDLSSCTNGCDVMVNQCQENLSGCTTNLDSMTNYANSLSDQLNQCLANSPDSCEGTGCDQISSGINVLFSFFWEREDQMFSLPISNNVFLPKGYRAYIDSGVVAITEYEKQSYDIDDSSFDEINKSFYSLIYGFIFLSAVALFCYYLKKFISKSFIPKENKG